MVVWLPRPIDATVHPEPGNRPEAWDSASKRMRTTEALAAPDAASFAADADVAAALSLGPPQEGGAAPAIAGQLSGVDASAISVDLSSSGASSVTLAYTISASSAESAQAIILKFRVCLH